MEQIAWVQDSAFSTWVRESSWALFAALIVHTFGMGLAVGSATAINLRLLGAAKAIPPPSLGRLGPIIAAGLLAAALSGSILVIGYPAKALTNPLFYAKLTAVAAALALSVRLVRQAASSPGQPAWTKPAAAVCLTLWAFGVVGGRFLAYTHKMLLVY